MPQSRRKPPSQSTIRRGGAPHIKRLPPDASRDVILDAYHRAALQGVTQKEFERDALGIKNPTGRYIRLVHEGKRTGRNIEAEGRRSIGVRNKVQVTFHGPKGEHKSATMVILGKDISRLDLATLKQYLLDNPDTFDDIWMDWDRRYAKREFDEDDWDREDFDLHYVSGLSDAREFYRIRPDI